MIFHPLWETDSLVKIEVAERDYLSKVFKQLPDRETIIGMIDDGTLAGEQIGRGRNWYVYESSLLNFITALTDRRQQKLAA